MLQMLWYLAVQLCQHVGTFFQRAISALAMSYFGNQYLVVKHKRWLDMVKWSGPPNKDVVSVQAESCSKNRDMHNEDGAEQPSPHNIYVDGSLLADTRRRMSQTLEVVVEAIFLIMVYQNWRYVYVLLLWINGCCWKFIQSKYFWACFGTCET